MSHENVNVRIEDRVGWLGYQRPPVNAFDWAMLHEVGQVLSEFLADSRVRVIIFASALEKYFTVGADIRMMLEAEQDGMRKWVRTCHALVRQMRQARKPLLAAIHGTAVGAGLELVMHGDVRFAAADARLGQPEINIAYIPGVGTTQSLGRLLGRPRAFRFLYEGTLVSAHEALGMGLVDIVVPPERLRDEAQSYAVALASKPAEALAAIRRCITEGLEVPFDEGLEIELEEAIRLAGMPNFAEGLRAFLERRPPRWA